VIPYLHSMSIDGRDQRLCSHNWLRP